MASFWGPTKKTYNSSQTAAKLSAVNLSSAGAMNYKYIYHGNILLMDNKRRKSPATKQSKGCKFVPEMHQIRLAAGPAGGAFALTQAT